MRQRWLSYFDSNTQRFNPSTNTATSRSWLVLNGALWKETSGWGHAAWNQRQQAPGERAKQVALSLITICNARLSANIFYRSSCPLSLRSTPRHLLHTQCLKLTLRVFQHCGMSKSPGEPDGSAADGYAKRPKLAHEGKSCFRACLSGLMCNILTTRSPIPSTSSKLKQVFKMKRIAGRHFWSTTVTEIPDTRNPTVLCAQPLTRWRRSSTFSINHSASI